MSPDELNFVSASEVRSKYACLINRQGILLALVFFSYKCALDALRQKTNLAKMLVDDYRKGRNPFK